MDFFDAVKSRRSTRKFIDKPLSKEIINKMIDAARLAPTARNVQPWEFVAITDKDKIKRISELAENGRFVVGAPLCIAVFCSDTKYYLEDGCAATANLLNAAAALGIASCWIAGDKKPYCEEVGRLVNAPSGYKLVSLIALGLGAEKPEPPKRDLEKMIHWESFTTS